MNDLINRAERFARARHEGQFRKGKAQEPYTIHLEEVAVLVGRWSGSERAIAAAWLHDTVEDCPPTSLAELETLFSKEVADIVAELTDDKALPKASQKEQQLQKRHSGYKSSGNPHIFDRVRLSNYAVIFSFIEGVMTLINILGLSLL